MPGKLEYVDDDDERLNSFKNNLVIINVFKLISSVDAIRKLIVIRPFIFNNVLALLQRYLHLL